MSKSIACAVLLVIVGALTAAIAMTADKLSAATARLASAEGNARTAWAKVYAAEETQQDELEAARSAGSVELYALQLKLDACEKGKKP